MKKAKTAGLVLAAGESRRMGKPKQLLVWNGMTLIAHAVRELQTVCDFVLVITGESDAEIRAVLDEKANTLFNKEWKNGMGTSIACGISEIERIGGFDQVLITTCDQPGLRHRHYRGLLEQKRDALGIATDYGGQGGVPAVFSEPYWSRLRDLSQDRGARALINDTMYPFRRIKPLGDSRDIDTPEDFQDLTGKAFQD
jgi:molybdenum cofactor cytidylyltransferase